MSDDDTQHRIGIDIPFDVADWGDVPAPARWDELSAEERREAEDAFGADALPPVHPDVRALEAQVGLLTDHVAELAAELEDVGRRARGRQQATSGRRKKVMRRGAGEGLLGEHLAMLGQRTAGRSVIGATYGMALELATRDVFFVGIGVEPGPAASNAERTRAAIDRGLKIAADTRMGLVVSGEDGTVLLTLSASQVALGVDASSVEGDIVQNVLPPTRRGGKV